MNPVRGRRRFGPVVAATGLLLLASAPAGFAAPVNTAISAYQMPCGQAICDDEHRIAADDPVQGQVQLQAETSSTLGLETVEIQLQVGGEWRCVYRWTTSARSGRWQRNLDPSRPLSGCNDATLTDGSNGSYRFRTFATDRSGSQASPVFVLKVSNPPASPSWVSKPVRSSDLDEHPSIRLSWYRNPEPDIVEYHFVRSGPDGTREYAVSATHPGGQGCTLDGNAYVCIDDDFPETGFDGTYAYQLLAFRSSPDDTSSCSLPGGGSCVYSTRSAARQLTLKTAPDPQTQSGGGNGGSGGPPAPPGRPAPPVRTGPPTLGEIAGRGFTKEGTYDNQLPYQARPRLTLPSNRSGNGSEDLAADPDLTGSIAAERQRRNMTALAGGLLLLVIAVHLARMLKAAPRSRR